MNKFLRHLIFIAIGSLSVAGILSPVVAQARDQCCFCSLGSRQMCVTFNMSGTDDCLNWRNDVAFRGMTDAQLNGFTCQTTNPAEGSCVLSGGGGAGRCTSATITANDAHSQAVAAGTASTPTATPATGPTTCCKCHQDSNNWCVKFSSISNCSGFAQNAIYQQLNTNSPARVAGFTCDAQALSSTQCIAQTSGNTGQCPGEPITDTGLGGAIRAAAGQQAAQTGPLVPALSVGIPGLVFSTPQTSGGCTTFPWLGEYIAAIYRYMLTIITTVVLVMVVYGGFRYLVGAGTGDIVRGKEIIRDAILGMFIAYGAYIILYTVNPDTLTMHMPCISNIARLELDIDQSLQTVTTTTSGLPNIPYAASYPDCPVHNLPQGHFNLPPGCGGHQANAPVCSDHALNGNPNSNDPRTLAFAAGMRSLLTTTDPQQRILQVAEAAAKCGITMGCCGLTADAIWRIAGVTVTHSHQMVPQAEILVRLGVSSYCNAARTRPAPQPSPGGCTNDKAAALGIVRAFVQSTQDAVEASLQPGDQIVMYNAGDWEGGSHAAIFMGRQGNSDQTVWGQDGLQVRASPYCFRTTGCGAFLPILKIYRAPELMHR